MKKQFALALLLATTAFAASAGELNYTYVEGGYAKVHIDAADFNNPEGDGGFLRGSVAVGPQSYLFGSVGKVSNDFDVFGTKVDIDVNQSEIGMGYHQSMSERVDFIAELAYQRLEIKASVQGFGSESDDAKGGRISVGLRGQMSDRVEGWLKAGYLDGGDFEGAFAGTLGGQFKFNSTWGLVGEVEIIEDTTRYLAGVRASF